MTLAELLGQDFGFMPDLIRAHAAERPTQAALILDGQSLDYAGFDRRIDQVAVALQRDGLAPREVVAICATGSLEYAAVFWGALRAGLAVAPLAPDALPDNLAGMVLDSGARRLFLDAGVAARLQPVLGRIGVPCIGLDDSAGPGTAGGAAPRQQPLGEWLVAPGQRPQPVAVQPDWPFNIIYSSGTTGTPKGIAVPHSFRWSSLAVFSMQGYGPDAVVLVSIPLYSNMTLSSFLPALAFGGTVVLMPKFDAGQYLVLAERHRVTHSMMVPVQYQRIMARPDFDRFDLSSYRVKACGSAPFNAALKADVVARWPGELFEFYGMTEGGGVCVLNARLHPHKLHTVGQPAPGSDMRVIDDDGRELPRGATGEIVGRSGSMMTGYHNLPDKTAQAEWFDAQGLRFIRTGDVGRFDEDGFLVLMDRKKDMIISGGFNVYPSDLEAVLRQHPAVAEVAVTGVPSQRWGETPVGFVVRREGEAGQVDADTLLAWAHERLGKAQRLAALQFVAALPRSDIGKVLKRELRDRWLADNAAAGAAPT